MVETRAVRRAKALLEIVEIGLSSEKKSATAEADGRDFYRKTYRRRIPSTFTNKHQEVL